MTRLSDRPKGTWSDLQAALACPLCRSVAQEGGFGDGPYDYHGPEDVHPRMTCAEVAELEW